MWLGWNAKKLVNAVRKRRTQPTDFNLNPALQKLMRSNEVALETSISKSAEALSLRPIFRKRGISILASNQPFRRLRHPID